MLLRSRHVLAIAAIAGTLVVVPDTAAASVHAGMLLGAPAAPPGVTQSLVRPGSVSKAGATEVGLLTTRPANGTVLPAGEGGGFGCDTFIDTATDSVGEDDFLEETGHVDYFAEVDCNFFLDSIEAIAGVIDRSASFNGQDFNGAVLGTGSYFYDEEVSSADSTGAIDLRARTYNGGRKVEAAFEMYLLAPIDFVWDSCNPIPGLRYLACDGLGGDLLHVVVGTGKFGTGLTAACRDQTAPVDAEQARLTVPVGGSVPASTQLLRRIDAIKQLVTSFKRDLCFRTGNSDAKSFMDQRGQQLWDTAVAQAKAGAAAGDDRPLYWARLAMTTAVHQWRPAFTVTQSNLEGRLDRASRGLNSHGFTMGTSRRAFISGFDPFGFSSGILASNPSGVSVLPLDSTVLNGAEVQAIVLPVRYADFDAGVVEDAFGQHIGTGAQAATIITSVSQGGDDFAFDLEFYNGRNRASQGPGLPAIPDNRNELGGRGTYDRPVAPTFPLNQAVTSQFTMTSLPVDDMLQSGPAEINTQVDQQFPAGSRSAPRADGFSVGATAVQGSGGGFLSNEVAYRVTRLRDELHSNVAAGHVHTAFLRVPGSITDPTWEAERRSIASQYRGMLFQAIPEAGVSIPVALTLNKITYRVGEVPTYNVIGPANKALKWSSTFNGAPTSEADTGYGTMTDANRRWTGTIGPAWTAAQVGSWVKYVRVDGRLAQFAFTVTN